MSSEGEGRSTAPAQYERWGGEGPQFYCLLNTLDKPLGNSKSLSLPTMPGSGYKVAKLTGVSLPQAISALLDTTCRNTYTKPDPQEATRQRSGSH